MHKKGLGDVVSNVLIVLLGFIAVAILGTIVLNVVNNSSDSLTSNIITSSIILDINPSSVVINETPSGSKNVSFIIQSKSGDANISAFNVVATDVNKKTHVERVNTSLKLYESKRLEIVIGASELDTLYSISAIPVIEYENKEILGKKVEYVLPSVLPLSPIANETNNTREIINISSCVTINQSEVDYILTKNLNTNGNCLVINADNITLNGNGYSINHNVPPAYNYDYGIKVNASNVNLSNLIIKNFFFSLYFSDYTHNNKAHNNSIINSINGATGIYVSRSSNNILSNNLIKTDTGFYIFQNSNNNQLLSNTFDTTYKDVVCNNAGANNVFSGSCRVQYNCNSWITCS